MQAGPLQPQNSLELYKSQLNGQKYAVGVCVPLQGKGAFTAATNSGRAAALNTNSGGDGDGDGEPSQVGTYVPHSCTIATKNIYYIILSSTPYIFIIKFRQTPRGFYFIYIYYIFHCIWPF